MTVRLHIDRVVVDAGLGVARADARLLERAIIEQLGGSVATANVKWCSHSVVMLRMDTVASTQAGPEAFAGGIADAVAGIVRR